MQAASLSAAGTQLLQGVLAAQQGHQIAAIDAFTATRSQQPTPRERALAWEGQALVLRQLGDVAGENAAFEQAIHAARAVQDRTRVQRLRRLRDTPDMEVNFSGLRNEIDAGKVALAPTASGHAAAAGKAAAPSLATKKKDDCGYNVRNYLKTLCTTLPPLASRDALSPFFAVSTLIIAPTWLRESREARGAIAAQNVLR